MSVPSKLVINCSATGAPDPAIADEFHKAALAILQDAGNEPGDRELALEKAARLMQDANDVLTATAVPTETIVPLTDDEIAQRDIDEAAAAAQTKADADAAAATAALVAKLAKGSATGAEVQQALAQLLS